MRPSHRVVVTGYGSLTSLGETTQESWDAIMGYRTGYRKHSFPDSSIVAKYFSFVEDRRERYKWIPKPLTRALPTFAKFAMVASREALMQAFGDADEVARHYTPFDCGAVIGTGWGGSDQLSQSQDEYRESKLCTPMRTLVSMPSIATAAVTQHWRLRGYQSTVNAACATGTIAIGDAYHVIKSGRAKMMLAGGAESLREAANVWSIDVLGALSKEQENDAKACCPFSADRSGFVLAEGAAVLCLEEREHAIARGARILGEITGYGNYSDASDFTAPADDMLARVATLQAAVREAGIEPDELDYINAHGTSTPLNDLNESNSIKAAFGHAAYGIPLSSTKSYTGHLIAAAGSFETIVCLKAIETKTLPATVNLHRPDPACDLNYLPNEHVQAPRVDRTLNLSFGFGGANAALVIERAR